MGGDDFFDRGFEVGLTDSYNTRSDALYGAPIHAPGPIYGRRQVWNLYHFVSQCNTHAILVTGRPPRPGCLRAGV